MSITKRLLLGYGCIILLLAISTGYFTSSQLEKMSGENERIIDSINASQDQMSRLEASLFQLNNAIYQFYSDYSGESLELLLDSFKKVLINLVSIRTAYASPDLSSAIQPAESWIKLQIQIMEDLQKISPSVNLKSSNAIMDYTPQSILSEINSAVLLSNIQKYFLGQMMYAKESMVQIRRSTFIYLGLIYLFAVVSGLLISILLSRSITMTVRRSSDQLSAVSDEILGTSDDESKTSLTQSEEISQASDTLKGLSASANEIANSTTEVSATVTTTSDQIAKLKKATSKIEKIAIVIEEISQQINILSLNASIEAFRAGDQGKGFSAVAMEIRKLAESTKSSTGGISSLVKDIHDAATLTTKSMESAVERVSHISEFVNQQNRDTDHISEAVERIDQGMQTSVQNIQKTKTAAEELHQIAQKLRSLI